MISSQITHLRVTNLANQAARRPRATSRVPKVHPQSPRSNKIKHESQAHNPRGKLLTFGARTLERNFSNSKLAARPRGRPPCIRPFSSILHLKVPRGPVRNRRYSIGPAGRKIAHRRPLIENYYIYTSMYRIERGPRHLRLALARGLSYFPADLCPSFIESARALSLSLRRVRAGALRHAAALLSFCSSSFYPPLSLSLSAYFIQRALSSPRSPVFPLALPAQLLFLLPLRFFPSFSCRSLSLSFRLVSPAGFLFVRLPRPCPACAIESRRARGGGGKKKCESTPDFLAVARLFPRFFCGTRAVFVARRLRIYTFVCAFGGSSGIFMRLGFFRAIAVTSLGCDWDAIRGRSGCCIESVMDACA